MRLPLWFCAPILVCWAFTASPARAGAWLQPKGDGYGKVSLLAQRTAQRLDDEGNPANANPGGADYAEQQVFFYGEWGLKHWFTALGSFAIKNQTIETTPEFGTLSTGDLRLGGRLGLVQGPKSLAIESLVWIPTYPKSDLSQPPSQREQFLPAGTGEPALEIRLLGGLSLFPLPLYTNLDVGYLARGGEFTDQWLGTVEFGGSNQNLFAKLELRWLFEASSGGVDLVGGRVSPPERFLRAGIELAFRVVGPAWFNLGYSPLIQGQNTLDSNQWGFGLVYWQPPS